MDLSVEPLTLGVVLTTAGAHPRTEAGGEGASAAAVIDTSSRQIMF